MSTALTNFTPKDSKTDKSDKTNVVSNNDFSTRDLWR